ncbi:MAG: hypothetical protein ACXVLQ_13150 [Bacteriovorax sp.]
MKQTLLFCFMTLFTSNAFSAVVQSHDKENSCTLYKVVSGDSNGKVALRSGEVIINSKEAYGLSFQDMEVNFDGHEVMIQPMINIVLGFNRPLTAGKVSIPEEHPEFQFLINQLNRKVSFFEKICISSDNKVVYAKILEHKQE